MRSTETQGCLENCAKRIRAWMTEQAFPFWAKVGMHESGAAWEAIDFSGNPIQSDLSRVRVQARQLVSFALAHKLGWDTDRSRTIVEQLFAVLRNGCRRPDGLYGRTMNISQLALVDDTADLYDNAFVLLAYSHAHSVIGGAAVRDEIDSLLSGLEDNLRSQSNRGYAEWLPAPGFRLQNPHMHLFESLLSLYSTSRDDALRPRIGQLLTFIEQTFFDEAESIVREIQESADPSHCDYFEPGHSMEWVWLLGWRSRLYNQTLPVFATALYEKALASRNLDGRMPMKVTVSGDPVDASIRLWSQTEALKAHLCIAESGPKDAVAPAVVEAIQCCEDLHEQWLQPAVRGGWHDHFDAQAKLIAKDIPASTGYHIFVAFDELLRIVNGCSSSEA